MMNVSMNVIIALENVYTLCKEMHNNAGFHDLIAILFCALLANP